MKYEIGTLILGKSQDGKTTAFAVITEAYLNTEEYRISILRNRDGRGTEWDSGTWSEAVIEVWENDYGYTFVK